MKNLINTKKKILLPFTTEGKDESKNSLNISTDIGLSSLKFLLFLRHRVDKHFAGQETDDWK